MGKFCAQLPVAQRAAQRKDAAAKPAEHQYEGVAQFRHDKTGRGENAGPHHVRDHQDGGGKKSDLPQQVAVAVKCRFHVDPCPCLTIPCN